jgi:hypothetical protein
MQRTAIQRTAILGAVILALLTAAACGSAPKPSAQQQPASTAGPSTAPPSVSPSPPAAASKTSAPETNPQGDIPDNQQYVAYAPPGGGFSVKVPEGWSRTGTPPTVTFTDKLNSIRIETAPSPSAPTAASVQREISAFRTTATHFSGGAVSTIQRKAGSVVLATYRTDASPDPVTGKVRNDDVERYHFWKAGKLVTLTLAGPHGADNVDPWRIVTDSFRWTA